MVSNPAARRRSSIPTQENHQPCPASASPPPSKPLPPPPSRCSRASRRSSAASPNLFRLARREPGGARGLPRAQRRTRQGLARCPHPRAHCARRRRVQRLRLLHCRRTRSSARTWRASPTPRSPPIATAPPLTTRRRRPSKFAVRVVDDARPRLRCRRRCGQARGLLRRRGGRDRAARRAQHADQLRQRGRARRRSTSRSSRRATRHDRRAHSTRATSPSRPTVKAIQQRRGSRASYARMEAGRGWSTTITPDLADFIAAQTSVFLGTAERGRAALHPASRRPAGIPARARRADDRLRRLSRQPAVHLAGQPRRQPARPSCS